MAKYYAPVDAKQKFISDCEGESGVANEVLFLVLDHFPKDQKDAIEKRDVETMFSQELFAIRPQTKLNPTQWKERIAVYAGLILLDDIMIQFVKLGYLVKVDDVLDS